MLHSLVVSNLLAPSACVETGCLLFPMTNAFFGDTLTYVLTFPCARVIKCDS